MRKLLLIAVLFLGAFNIFYNVSVQPVAEWDEARHIASAVEMAHSRDFIVTRYEGKPDYWNVKPPLSVWGGALGYSLLENKFVGVRLLSLLLSVVLIAAVFLYARRIAGTQAGLLASLLLVMAPSIVLKHAMRSSDADIYLVSGVTLAMLAFSCNRRWFVALGYVALGCAFLAKSFHVAPYGVAAFVYTLYLYRQRHLDLWEVLLLPFCFLLPVLPWALARYLADGTKFFEVMFFYDVLKRSTEAIEGHNEPIFMYAGKILSPFLVPLLFMAWLASIRNTRHLFRDARLVLLGLWILIPLFVYSMAKTRLGWYIYPVYPAIVIVAGIMLVRSRELLTRRQWGVVVAMLLLGLVVNEGRIVRQILHTRGDFAVQQALGSLSAQSTPKIINVYIEPDAPGQDSWRLRQHHYATALLLGNIRLLPGGRAAFLEQTGPAYLIGDGGKVGRR